MNAFVQPCRKPLSCLVCLAMSASLSLADDRHVAKTGNDAAGNGSAASPHLTINRALQAAQPGDAIVIHEGVYNEGVRVLLPNITLKSADGEQAVIQSEVGTGDNPGRCVMFDVDASGGTLQGLDLIGGYYTIFLQSRWDWGGPDRGGASDILIEDCRISGSGRDCIKITPNCDRITIRRCEIFDSGRLYPPGTPFDQKNAEGIDSTNGDRVLVQDCYVHDIATTGIYFKGGATDCVVERTRVARCGQAGILLGFDTSPEFFDLEANPDYYECIRGVVRNCIVEDTDYAGIGFYALRDGLAANNTVINTAKVAHSPIYFGVTIQDYDPNAGRPASVNVRVVNNIVAQFDAIASPAVSIRYLYEPELGELAGIDGMPVMSNNLYYSAAGGPAFADRRPESLLDNGDLAAWQANIAGDADSFVADPMLDENGRLTAGSPAIGQGVALEAVMDDFDGEARANAVDIGAHQFASTSPNPADPGEVPGGQPQPGGSGTLGTPGGNPSGGNPGGDDLGSGGGSGSGGGGGGGDGSGGGGSDGGSDDGDRETTGGVDPDPDADPGRDEPSDDASDDQSGSGAIDSDGDDREVRDNPPLVPTGALCPMVAMATLSLSLAGIRRTRRATVRRSSRVQ